ncbi:uncharacterized protein CTRU02_214693 [Colletotrichum truncatum]|uniref:Uncharacterized protein n=1 Tax=Colletotrichum truncatum TaxID=5467 RepID=A0ACC3YFE4_COLTU
MLGNGIPLSSLAPGLKFSRPSFLWSRDMLALLSADLSTIWKKSAYLVCVVAFSAFTVIVTPATASALTPELDWHEAGGATVWLNSSESALFPAELDSSAVVGQHCLVEGDSRCPSARWRQLHDGYLEYLTAETIYNPKLLGKDYYWNQRHTPQSPAIVSGIRSNLACLNDSEVAHNT